MSLDYWLQGFNKEEEGFFPLSVIETAFSGAITDKEDTGNRVIFCLRYPDEEDYFLEVDVTSDVPALTSGFHLLRPPAHDAFWQSLVDVLRASPSVFFWAESANALVVGQESTRAQLPPDMIETLGEPRLVLSHRDIFS
jgi:hypothetical protein